MPNSRYWTMRHPWVYSNSVDADGQARSDSYGVASVAGSKQVSSSLKDLDGGFNFGLGIARDVDAQAATSGLGSSANFRPNCRLWCILLPSRWLIRCGANSSARTFGKDCFRSVLMVQMDRSFPGSAYGQWT